MESADLGERTKFGRNDPCRCGSGKKYKKCCIDSDVPLDGRRVIERGGQKMVVSSRVTDTQLASADEFFAAKAAGRGPAADMADFAAPLLDATDGSAEQIQQALHLAMAFWNLAIVGDDDERQHAIDEIMTKAFDAGEQREHFEALAADMIERHHTMFPELHENGNRP